MLTTIWPFIHESVQRIEDFFDWLIDTYAIGAIEKKEEKTFSIFRWNPQADESRRKGKGEKGIRPNWK